MKHTITVDWGILVQRPAIYRIMLKVIESLDNMPVIGRWHARQTTLGWLIRHRLWHIVTLPEKHFAAALRVAIQ